MKDFKKLSDHKDVDVVKYLKERLNENSSLMIGTDSQNTSTHTHYATVIVIYQDKIGGHVLYSRESHPKITNSFKKLWKEVEYSINTAVYLQENGLPKPAFIDLDLNPDPMYKSNSVLRAALGYVESMGFKPRIKPYAYAASSVADHILV